MKWHIFLGIAPKCRGMLSVEMVENLVTVIKFEIVSDP